MDLDLKGIDPELLALIEERPAPEELLPPWEQKEGGNGNGAPPRVSGRSGIASVGGSGSPTPNQRISFEIQGPKFQTHQHPSILERKADKFKPQRRHVWSKAPDKPALETLDVRYAPGPCYIMRSQRGQAISVKSVDFDGTAVAPDLGNQVGTPRGLTIKPPNFGFVQASRPSPLKGIEEAGVLPAPHPKQIRKRVPHTGGVEGDWGDPANNMLAQDEQDLPPPVTDVDNQIPADRVFIAPGPFGANNGFQFFFTVDHQPYGWDKLFRIYFGGSTEVSPTPQEDVRSDGAGLFCLELVGNGHATLYERSRPAADEAGNPLRQTGWDERFRFQWAHQELLSKGLCYVQIVPYDTNHIGFISGAVSVGKPNFTLIVLLVDIAVLAIDAALHNQPNYRETSQVSHHTHQHAMTGVGPLRVDMRRDIRTPWVPLRIKFPNEATLVDAVIHLPGGLDDNTKLAYQMDKFVDAGGSITMHLYDADTGEELPKDDQYFYTINKQPNVVPYFVFRSDQDGAPANGPAPPEEPNFATPVLRGYSLSQPGLEVVQIDPWIEVKNLKQMSIAGPDIHDFTHETAAVSLQDLNDTGSKLRETGRVHTRICLRARDGGFDRDGNPWGYFDHAFTKDPGIPGTLISVLFEGEVDRKAPPRANKRGRLQPHGRYIGSGVAGTRVRSRGDNWWRYPAVRQAGMWARIQDKYSYGGDGKGSLLNFYDSDSPDCPEHYSGFPIKKNPLNKSQNAPWRVSDALWKCLRMAGCLNEEIDVPDMSTRFVYLRENSDNHALMIIPGQRMEQPILFFSRDVLMGALIREPNARPPSTAPGGFTFGMWRFLPPAQLQDVLLPDGSVSQAKDPIRMEFWSASYPRPNAPGSGKQVISAVDGLTAYATVPDAPQVIIEDGTFDLRTEPPGANLVRVVGGIPADTWGRTESQIKGQPWSKRIEQILYNYKSLWLGPPLPDLRDPDDPSYLDAGLVPLVIADPTLETQDEVDFVCARQFDVNCFARLWGTWRSPLRVITDNSDRGMCTTRDGNGVPTGKVPCLVDESGNPTQRPLRPQDLVLVHLMYPQKPGLAPEPSDWLGIVANCNPESRSTIHRMGMEVLLLRDRLVPVAL